MSNIDGSTISGLLSTPLVLPASVAGALAALFVVLVVMLLRRAGASGIGRLLLPVAGLVILALAAIALTDRLALDSRAAERRALLSRDAELTARVLAPGSALACLDGGAGETVGNVCEKVVFADAQSAAGAVAYMAARLQLLRDAAALGDRDVSATLEASRHAIEIDRYGIAAQVLAAREGCTAVHCDAFTLVSDASTLKANLRARVFEQYVSRYAAAWTAPAERAPQQPAVSEAPPAAPAPAPVASATSPPTGHPVDSKWDFPSAASIPPVSIMNAEPPLPKGAAEAQGSQPVPAGEAPTIPVPPKRPQTQAAAPPAR